MATIFSNPPSLPKIFQRRKSSLVSTNTPSDELDTALKGINIHHPIHTGKIFKHATDGSKFNKRFFVLYPKILLYYEHERNYYEELALGKLRKCRLFKLDDLHLSLVSAEDIPLGAKFCFRLHIPHSSNPRNELILAFNSRKNKRKWMAYLQSQNPHLLDPD